MRQLGYNYTFRSGYVPPYPAIPSGVLIYPLLYGLSSNQTVTPLEVLSFSIILSNTEPASITFPATNGKYLNILVPAQFGAIDHFIFNNFPVRFNQLNNAVSDNSQIEPAFVIVDGINFGFNWYQSQYPQHGENLTVYFP